MEKITIIDRNDNVGVALKDLIDGETVDIGNQEIKIAEPIKFKHKFALRDFQIGDPIIMYNTLVGEAKQAIPKGGLLTPFNVKHASAEFTSKTGHYDYTPPNVEKWLSRTFLGFERENGEVGTANVWLLVPLVFCENANLKKLHQALNSELGYNDDDKWKIKTKEYLGDLQNESTTINTSINSNQAQVFKNIDSIQFLEHHLGCGGTRSDSEALCGLLAGYITNPNVAGATVFSLGCQHAQADILKEEIEKRIPGLKKPVYYFDHQEEGTEDKLIDKALQFTLKGLAEANKIERQPFSLSKLTIGLECGGSDGFSGLSANPLLGKISDIISALGGAVVLSEFPELCGVEQSLINRSVNQEVADKFSNLMRNYEARAVESGSSFSMNPSPGNIKDGLITDAIKSAGAAKKGGSSPVMDVLDYPEKVRKKGLNLLCTPGNDVESTTAEAAAGCNIVLFTTGLGTPTGNPVSPVIKVSTNTELASKMPDIIDFDAGPIVYDPNKMDILVDKLMDLIIEVASGEKETKAKRNKQFDFIPWKRGVSL